MSEATIARPYARALFNIAQADNAMAEWVEALDASAAMVEHPDFKSILGAPALTHSALIEMLSEASAKSGVSGEQLKNFRVNWSPISGCPYCHTLPSALRHLHWLPVGRNMPK